MNQQFDGKNVPILDGLNEVSDLFNLQLSRRLEVSLRLTLSKSGQTQLNVAKTSQDHNRLALKFFSALVLQDQWKMQSIRKLGNDRAIPNNARHKANIKLIGDEYMGRAK